jgi:hypothetical protein
MKSLLKWLVTAGFNLLLLLLCLEVGGVLLFAAQSGKLLYFRHAGRAEVEQNPFMSGDFHGVVHPYFGFSFKPNRDHIAYVTPNNHNFLFHPEYVLRHSGCCDYPITQSDADEVVLGVFGGSVAAALAVRMQENETLRQNIAAGFGGKRVRVLTFALGGQKQPQQLIILTYYLSLGQVFDVIINVDGFNEIITSTGNLDAGTEANFPAHPMWRPLVDFLDRQASQAHSPEGVLANYHMLMSPRWERHVADCRSGVCYSIARLIEFWHRYNAMGENSEGREPFFFQVDPTPSTKLRHLDIAAERWAAASVLMAQMARSRGAIYLHTLQPNQWYRQTTPYEPRETDSIADLYRRTVPAGYEAFRAKGRELHQRGVNFFDASEILDAEPNDIYSDNVGHFTPQGYDILAGAIARALTARSAN